MFKAFGIAAILMLCFLTAGHMDYAAALEAEADEKMARVERVLRESPFQPQNHPTRAPRCQKWNVDREPLKHSFAAKPDLGEWVHECTYRRNT